MKPYIIKTIEERAWNPDYPQDKRCSKCFHPYHRHFDEYEDNAPVGCKYCQCYTFSEEEIDYNQLALTLQLIEVADRSYPGDDEDQDYSAEYDALNIASEIVKTYPNLIAALKLAIDTIEGLSEQQAMYDDWHEEPLKALKKWIEQ